MQEQEKYLGIRTETHQQEDLKEFRSKVVLATPRLAGILNQIKLERKHDTEHWNQKEGTEAGEIVRHEKNDSLPGRLEGPWNQCCLDHSKTC